MSLLGDDGYCEYIGAARSRYRSIPRLDIIECIIIHPFVYLLLKTIK